MTVPGIDSSFRPDLFRGRVCGVTGGAHRIGEATVKHLAHLGAAVVVLDRDEANLSRVERDLEQAGAESLCLAGDVTDGAFLETVFVQIDRRWGRLDGWVNNVKCNVRRELDAQTMAEFTRVWEVNVLASWRSIQLAAPRMQAAGAGSIVNVSSVMAQRSIVGNAAYTSAKAGMEGLTRALAVELAPHGVRVNAVEPGGIRTPEEYAQAGLAGLPPDAPDALRQAAARAVAEIAAGSQPWPRPGIATDIADAIVFLLSPASQFITGATVAVDGGCLADFRHPKDPRFMAAVHAEVELARLHEQAKRV